MNADELNVAHLWKEHQSVSKVVNRVNLTDEQVIAILESLNRQGEVVYPPPKPGKQGCNPRAIRRTANNVAFTHAVIRLAKLMLTEQEFAALCENNRFSLSQGNSYAIKLEQFNDEQFYSRVLRCQAKSLSLGACCTKHRTETL